jgi:hypothetical protein
MQKRDNPYGKSKYETFQWIFKDVLLSLCGNLLKGERHGNLKVKLNTRITECLHVGDPLHEGVGVIKTTNFQYVTALACSG